MGRQKEGSSWVEKPWRDETAAGKGSPFQDWLCLGTRILSGFVFLKRHSLKEYPQCFWECLNPFSSPSKEKGFAPGVKGTRMTLLVFFVSSLYLPQNIGYIYMQNSPLPLSLPFPALGCGWMSTWSLPEPWVMGWMILHDFLRDFFPSQGYFLSGVDILKQFPWRCKSSLENWESLTGNTPIKPFLIPAPSSSAAPSCRNLRILATSPWVFFNLVLNFGNKEGFVPVPRCQL